MDNDKKQIETTQPEINHIQIIKRCKREALVLATVIYKVDGDKFDALIAEGMTPEDALEDLDSEVVDYKSVLIDEFDEIESKVDKL